MAGGAAIGHVLAQDVARWTRPGRIPAKPGIGMRARHCVPLRWRGDLLGLLMVIDADDDLSAADRALIDAAAREVATLLVGERASADAAVAADDALVADLLGLDPIRRERALAKVPERAGPRVVVLRADTPDHEHAEVALRHAVLVARRTGLATVAGTTAAVVRFGVPHAEELVAAANELAAGRFSCVAGVGPRVATLAEAWVSHRHAELATLAVPLLRPGPVVEASGLGVYDLLLRIPALDPTALPAPVATLLAADSRACSSARWRPTCGMPVPPRPPRPSCTSTAPRCTTASTASARSPALTPTTGKPASCSTWAWAWRACWVCSPSEQTVPDSPAPRP